MKNNDEELTGAIQDIMGISAQAPQKESEQLKENMKQHNFRMKGSEWNRLKEHFQGKGLSIASGLRMIILDYMKAHNL